MISWVLFLGSFASGPVALIALILGRPTEAAITLLMGVVMFTGSSVLDMLRDIGAEIHALRTQPPTSTERNTQADQAERKAS